MMGALGVPQLQGGELYFGSDKADQSITDAVVAKAGGVATLFAKREENFVSVASTVKKEDDTIAVGTTLDAKGPAYPKLSVGEPYYGEATVFGKAYDAGYEPLKDTKPAEGMTVYDPAVGSGGFLIQAHQYVEEQGQNAEDMFLYGQESNGTTWASIEQEHGTDSAGTREQINARAEAKALAAVFRFREGLQNFASSFAAARARALPSKTRGERRDIWRTNAKGGG